MLKKNLGFADAMSITAWTWIALFFGAIAGASYEITAREAPVVVLLMLLYGLITGAAWSLTAHKRPSVSYPHRFRSVRFLLSMIALQILIVEIILALAGRDALVLIAHFL